MELDFTQRDYIRHISDVETTITAAEVARAMANLRNLRCWNRMTDERLRVVEQHLELLGLGLEAFALDTECEMCGRRAERCGCLRAVVVEAMAITPALVEEERVAYEAYCAYNARLADPEDSIWLGRRIF